MSPAVIAWQGRSTQKPAPPPEPATPMILAPEVRVWPCVLALTVDDLRSVKRQDVLVDVIRPRPGYSACEWRATSAANTGISISIATREEFAGEGVANAAELFAAELKGMLPALEPLAGLGDAAAVSPAVGGGDPYVMVRSGPAVLKVGCQDCTRPQVIALARIATGRLATAIAAVNQPSAVETGSPLPSLQIVDAATIKSVFGGGFTPTCVMVVVGESSCQWWPDDPKQSSRILSVKFVDRRAFVDRLMFWTAAPSAAGFYDFETKTFSDAGVKVEPISGIGIRAAAVDILGSTRVMVQRADGVLKIDSNLPRAQMLALARRAVAAPPPQLGMHASDSALGPPSPVGPKDLDASMRKTPCVGLLTPDEVRSLKRPEVLVDVFDQRPGFSWCEWRSTTSKQTGFMFTVMSREQFAEHKTATAAGYLAAERTALAATFQPEPLAGVGDEAIAVMLVPTQPFIMVRRGEQVLTINCVGCSREQAVALARLAAAK